MYETEISYHPLTGNTIMTIVADESFWYEEDGVGAMLTPTFHVMIDTKKPEVYCR